MSFLFLFSVCLPLVHFKSHDDLRFSYRTRKAKNCFFRCCLRAGKQRGAGETNKKREEKKRMASRFIVDFLLLTVLPAGDQPSPFYSCSPLPVSTPHAYIHTHTHTHTHTHQHKHYYSGRASAETRRKRNQNKEEKEEGSKKKNRGRLKNGEKGTNEESTRV